VPNGGAGPARSGIPLELSTVAIFGALAVTSTSGLTLAIHAAFATLLMMILAIDLRHRQVS
jgi:hypothetical protein